MKSIKLIIPAIFLLWAVTSLQAQITGPGSIGSFATTYSDGYVNGGGENDEVFVFCNTPATLSIDNGSGCDLMWYNYDGMSFVEMGNTSSSISDLESGIYMVRKTCGTTVECHRAWVWKTELLVSAATPEPGCDPFTLTGNVGTNGETITINDPPGEDFVIDENTYIKVCFWADHTYVSDLGFYLKSPGNQTAEPCDNNGVVQLCPAASDWGPSAAQGSWCGIPWSTLGCSNAYDENTTCNSGEDVREFCFKTHIAPGGNEIPAGTPANTPCVCDLPTPLSGDFGSVGPWSTIYGARAAAAGWAVQIYDCESRDVGHLTRATITFVGETECGTATFNYDSGDIHSAINDNSCRASIASLFVVPPRPPAGSYTVNTEISNVNWSSIPAGYSSQSSTLDVTNVPEENTNFIFEANMRVDLPDTDIRCSNNTSVEFITQPVNATITPLDPQCLNGPPVQLQTVDGGGTWQVNGAAPGNIIVDGYFYPNIAGVGDHTLTYTIDDVCNDEDEITVTVNDNIFIRNLVDTVCNESTYNVTFDVVDSQGQLVSFYFDLNDGDGRILVTSGNFTRSFASGTEYTIIVTDLNGCDQFELNGLWDCDCRTYAGTMTSLSTVILCEDERTNGRVSHNNNFINDGDDVLEFILHDGNNTRPPTFYSRSSTPDFAFTDITNGVYGTTYYISAIAANRLPNGNADLEDECLSISQGTPVIWLQNPVAQITTQAHSVCGKNTSLVAVDPIPGMTGFWSTAGGEYFIPTGGTTSNNPAMDLTVSEFGRVEFIWTVRNNMCTGSASVFVDFAEPPAAYAGPDQIVCGNTATLNATLTPGATGQWIGNGIFSPRTSPTATVESSGKQTFTWRESIGGCHSEDIVSVTFIENPAPSIVKQFDNACGESYYLSVQSTSRNGSWRAFDSNDQEIFPIFESGASSPNTNVRIGSYSELTRDVRFVWEESNSYQGHTCTGSASTLVTFMKQPNATISGSDIKEVCGNCITLEAMTDGTITGVEGQWLVKGGLQGTWTPNNTDSNTEFCATQAGIYGENGYGEYEIIWALKHTYNNYECVSSDMVTVKFFKTPEANAGMDKAVCGNIDTLGAIFSIPASDSYTPLGEWRTEGADIRPIPGHNSDTVEVVIGNNDYGILEFIFTERNSGKRECLSNDTVKIEFVKYPTVNVGDDRNICGNTAELVATDGGASSGIWSSTPTTTIVPPTDRNATITAVPGTYDVMWYAVNRNTMQGVAPAVCSHSDTLTIKFWQKPTATINNPPRDSVNCGKEFCNKLSAAPPGTGNHGIWTCQRPRVEITNETSLTEACVRVPNYGYYDFEWIVSIDYDDPNFKCADTASYQIKFIEIPVANAGEDKIFCGLRGNLTAGNSIGEGSWNSPDGVHIASEYSQTTEIDHNNYGTYRITRVQDNGNGCTDSDTVNITFVRIPSSDITFFPPKCAGEPAIIYATDSTLNGYEWIFNGGIVDRQVSNLHDAVYKNYVHWNINNPTDSVHTVTLVSMLKVNDEVSCPSVSNEITVREPSVPAYIYNITKDTCNLGKGGILFNPGGETLVDFTWLNDTIGDVYETSVTNVPAGIYDVRTLYVSPNHQYHDIYLREFLSKDCIDTVNIEIETTSMIEAAIDVDAGSLGGLVAPNAEVVFSNLTEYDNALKRCEWHFGDGTVERTCDPLVTHIYETPGEYSPYLIVMNRNLIACRDTARLDLKIIIGNSSSLDIPNVFSPNGDGINDYFQVTAESLEWFEGKILSRWGNQMHEWTNWSDETEGWNGKMNNTGSEASPGVYYYIIKAKGLDGAVYEFEGFLHLLKD